MSFTASLLLLLPVFPPLLLLCKYIFLSNFSNSASLHQFNSIRAVTNLAAFATMFPAVNASRGSSLSAVARYHYSTIYTTTQLSRHFMSTSVKPPSSLTAACCMIGDEILNGKTRDSNAHFLGEESFYSI